MHQNPKFWPFLWLTFYDFRPPKSSKKRISGHFYIPKSHRYMKNPRDVQAQAKHSSNARFWHENPVTWESNGQTYQKQYWNVRKMTKLQIMMTSYLPEGHPGVPLEEATRARTLLRSLVLLYDSKILF